MSKISDKERFDKQNETVIKDQMRKLQGLMMRSIGCDFKVNDKKERLLLHGYPIVFNSKAEIKGKGQIFNEIIMPGALDRCIMTETTLVEGHKLDSLPLARVPNTMSLVVDGKGLRMVAELADTAKGREVFSAVKRKDYRGMSFLFRFNGEKWLENTNTRLITSISEIYEVSLVIFPAYKDTTIEALLA